jgi:hypothetical protein
MIPGAESHNLLKNTFHELPQPAGLHQFFQQIFATSINRLAAAKKLENIEFFLEFAVPEQMKTVFAGQPDWTRQCIKAFSQSGMTCVARKSESTALLICAYDGPHTDTENRLVFTLPQKQQHRMQLSFVADQIADESLCGSHDHILIKRISNGLKVFDEHGVRVFPDVCGQSAYTRLASHIAIIMTSNQPPVRQG